MIFDPHEVRIGYGRFRDQRWRLNNLYEIRDARGQQVRFEMNWAQQALFEQMHTFNIVLKARQLGMTTFIPLLMLDTFLFTNDVAAAKVAHTPATSEPRWV